MKYYLLNKKVSFPIDVMMEVNPFQDARSVMEQFDSDEKSSGKGEAENGSYRI